MANAIDAGIWLTPPYGKSLHRGQLRQRDAAMRDPLRRLHAFAVMSRECGHSRRQNPIPRPN
jgi:hypothetical protein